MEEVASEEEVQMEEILSEPENRRVVSMDCPFQAYKVISRHTDLDYIRKLAALLDNVAKIMN